MELSYSEYPTALASLQSVDAIAVLDERVKLIGKINSDIADWLLERRKVEDAYAQGLRKLASRRPQESSFELGIFQSPWQTIVSATESLAQSHTLLAQNIETDVEKPLREYQTKNRDMQAMSTIQGNLNSIAKDLDGAQKRLEKFKGGKSSTKTANASSDVDAASQQWGSQAPYVFERLQALDENRVNHLRDVLTQLQTFEVDQVERNRISAERCLNALLNLDAADEISTFVARTSMGTPSMPRQKSRNATNNSLRPPTPARTYNDGVSEVSGTSAEQLRSLPSPEPRRFGLKRLGTVIGRRRQNSKPSDRPPSPERRPRPNLNPLRRGTSSRDMQTIPSPHGSSVNLASSLTRREPALPQPRIPPVVEASQLPLKQRPTNDQLNGDTIQPAPSRPDLPVANGVQPYPDLTPSQNTRSNTIPEKPVEARRDSEGFNIPPAINQESSHTELEASLSETEPQFKLDIRNEPIKEEDDKAQSALSNVANTLRAQVVTPRKPTINRGRRDVRNTIFVPSPPAPETPNFGDIPMPLPSPFSSSRSNTLSSEMPHNSDAQSVRSSHSIGSLMGAAIKHPVMHQPGLNVSIVETVSADFSQGQVTRSAVMGELALVHNPSETAPTASSETIRLENFPVLEKVAPNPAFIAELPSRNGEYSVDLSQISRTAVAFKYKVHLEDSYLAAHAPFTLTPVWKIEPTQASVILNYAFNSTFSSPIKRSVTLKNVMVVINIENSKALACRSRPVGTFSKEKSTIFWKLGDLTLGSEAQGPEKLLAQFSTESEAKSGTVEVRWEIDGEHSAGLGSGLGLSRISGSGVADPFTDEGTGVGPGNAWKEVAVLRKIVSGKYIAN